MDYYNTFQKKEKKSAVPELILFQEGQIKPHPHRFHAQFNIKSSGMTISVVLMMPYY